MDPSANNTSSANDQNAAQNIATAQQPIAHQVTQQNSGGSNGVPQQPLASNSPIPALNNASLASNGNNQNGALNGNGNVITLPCEWVGCGHRANNAELLYEHVCEVHVGRRSTNNLNLTCGWGSCRTATVKRDHITSHIRVHVPLKPHVCHACSKKFKRPQDLKKHVKTHADEHENQDAGNSNRSHHGQGQYGGQGQRVFYTEHPVQPSAGISYPFQGHGAQANYYAPTQQQQQGGGSNGYASFYSVDPNTNSHGPMSHYGNSYQTESRKRGVDAMNDFFGDAKRGRFDPSSYSEVGQRLLAFNGVQLPLPTHGSGNGGMLAEFLAQQSPPTPTILQTSSHRGSMGGGMYGPTAQAYQAVPPMPNIRSKRDLQVVDDILDQTLAAVYNNMPHKGITMTTQQGHGQRHNSQASVHGMRTSSSPPGMHSNTHAMAHSIHGSTPALTPSGSTVQSHSSGHSPTSNHDADLRDFETSHVTPSMHNQRMMGQPMQNNSHTVMYPSLPSANNGQGGYNVAPSANLGTHFDREVRRHQGGGRLGRARPADEEMRYDDAAGPSTEGDNNANPVESSDGEPAKKRRAHETKEDRFSRLNIDPNIDPALAGPAPNTSSTTTTTTPSASESEPGTPATAGGMRQSRVVELAPGQEAVVWEQRMELLLSLKSYVKARLELGEWEGGVEGEGEDAGARGIKREAVGMGEGSGQGLYPQLSVGGD